MVQHIREKKGRGHKVHLDEDTEADTVEDDTVEDNTVEADTTEADTIEADMDCM